MGVEPGGPFGLDDLPLEPFERLVLVGCHRVLLDTENPIRLNLFASGIREIFTHLLHRQAPDADVARCVWYVPPPDNKPPTRRQRARYAMQGGLTDAFVGRAGVEVDTLLQELLAAVDGLSKYTHVRPGSIVSDQAEIDTFVAEATAALRNLFSWIAECRAIVADAVVGTVNQAALHALVQQTVQELDELSSATAVEDVQVEDLTVVSLTHDAIVFDAVGEVSVELRWGSPSDFRRGDGASMDASFPFRMRLTARPADVEELDSFTVADVNVENNSWFGVDDQDEE